MKNRKNFVMGATTGIAMLFIIFDARTAARSAYEGIELCLRTVIPSLLPFFVLSGVINSCLMGSQFRILRPLGRLCKIPKGTESLLVLGFLAGYPVGAQLVTQSYQEGKISQKTARRMLGFCNNAGPGFLFGMLSPLFMFKQFPISGSITSKLIRHFNNLSSHDITLLTNYFCII